MLGSPTGFESVGFALRHEKTSKKSFFIRNTFQEQKKTMTCVMDSKILIYKLVGPHCMVLRIVAF